MAEAMSAAASAAARRCSDALNGRAQMLAVAHTCPPHSRECGPPSLPGLSQNIRQSRFGASLLFVPLLRVAAESPLRKLGVRGVCMKNLNGSLPMLSRCGWVTCSAIRCFPVAAAGARGYRLQSYRESPRTREGRSGSCVSPYTLRHQEKSRAGQCERQGEAENGVKVLESDIGGYAVEITPSIGVLWQKALEILDMEWNNCCAAHREANSEGHVVVRLWEEKATPHVVSNNVLAAACATTSRKKDGVEGGARSWIRSQQLVGSTPPCAGGRPQEIDAKAFRQSIDRANAALRGAPVSGGSWGGQRGRGGGNFRGGGPNGSHGGPQGPRSVGGELKREAYIPTGEMQQQAQQHRGSGHRYRRGGNRGWGSATSSSGPMRGGGFGGRLYGGGKIHGGEWRDWTVCISASARENVLTVLRARDLPPTWNAPTSGLFSAHAVTFRTYISKPTTMKGSPGKPVQAASQASKKCDDKWERDSHVSQQPTMDQTNMTMAA
ncbi:uncharacterized protein LOC113146854 [Cyclospora cayetanensis]|uniref:Uncharacterized protein LOC113146854 n=1 Tax=Cyclospora cayetanensis TaxID=88456 RepID=A0A6P6RUV2_9EIME|nr:uncharacterized protein LOC113146854 [Cyclospora cayetanensis]